MRLFTAINLPILVKEALKSHQPEKEKGIRLVKEPLMHLTLHFIGDFDTQKIDAGLKAIDAESFEITLSGTGRFESAKKGSILWVGVKQSDALAQLHQKIALCLDKAGVRPDNRAFHPHVTVARCQHRYGEERVQSFLETKLEPQVVEVKEFSLFNSECVEGELHYRLLHTYGLKKSLKEN